METVEFQGAIQYSPKPDCKNLRGAFLLEYRKWKTYGAVAEFRNRLDYHVVGQYFTPFPRRYHPGALSGYFWGGCELLSPNVIPSRFRRRADITDKTTTPLCQGLEWIYNRGASQPLWSKSRFRAHHDFLLCTAFCTLRNPFSKRNGGERLR